MSGLDALVKQSDADPILFGQLVIGPPGSGKTTYCHAMAEFLRGIGRKVAIVNIDPANESPPYEATIDLAELIRLEDVMDAMKLGPNGGLVYCMEFLEKNFAWLKTKVEAVKDHYLMIDCPGQIELYTHHKSVSTLLRLLEKTFDTRLCAVNLVDAHYCSEPAKFISVCLTSLNTMLQIELPHINVLSKVDQIEKYGRLDFNIDFYTDVLDLQFLVDRMTDDPFAVKYKKLNEALTDLIQNYSLVAFLPLNITSKERMLNVKNAVDKANGYCFGSKEEHTLRAMMSSAIGGAEFEYGKTMDIRENILKPDQVIERDLMDTEPETSQERAANMRVKDNMERLGNDLDQVDIGPGFQV